MPDPRQERKIIVMRTRASAGSWRGEAGASPARTSFHVDEKNHYTRTRTGRWIAKPCDAVPVMDESKYRRNLRWRTAEVNPTRRTKAPAKPDERRSACTSPGPLLRYHPGSRVRSGIPPREVFDWRTGRSTWPAPIPTNRSLANRLGHPCAIERRRRDQDALRLGRPNSTIIFARLASDSLPEWMLGRARDCSRGWRTGRRFHRTISMVRNRSHAIQLISAFCDCNGDCTQTHWLRS